MIERRGVELYELHVGYSSFSTIGHGLAVACSDDRVGGGEIYCTATTRTHYCDLAEVCVHLLCLRVKDIGSIALYVM